MSSKDNAFDKVFITVGTTEFDKLIKAIDNEEFLSFLSSMNTKQLTIQIGRGIYHPIYLENTCYSKYNIEFSCFRFKDTLAIDMNEASLIISHAGNILNNIYLLIKLTLY